MDINESKAFQEKLDGILKDTEAFVNAAGELRNTRLALDRYIKEAEKLSKSFGDTAKAANECALNASALMSGTFKRDIQNASEEAIAAIELCAEQSKALQKQYDEMLSLGNYKKLSDKIGTITRATEELKSIMKGIYAKEEENSEKLNRILSIIETLA